jgi:hypothetical protein
VRPGRSSRVAGFVAPAPVAAGVTQLGSSAGSAMIGAFVTGSWTEAAPPWKLTARTPTTIARTAMTTRARRTAFPAPRRAIRRAAGPDAPGAGGAAMTAAAAGRARSRGVRSGLGAVAGVIVGQVGAGTGPELRTDTPGVTATGPAGASWNGRQARQAPTTWFQQFEQHELEQAGQTLNRLAPADPSRSRSSPHFSQNVLPSSNPNRPLAIAGRTRAVP